MSILKTHNFLIVGTVRDCGHKLQHEVRHLHNIFKDALSVYWLIIESDSVDNTKETLHKLRFEIPNFDFITLGRMASEYPERASRIAACRDVYVEEIKKNKKYSNVDHVIVADLDGMCSDLTDHGLESCWNQKGWSGCFANQPGGYYDLWALRHKFWSPSDPFLTYKGLMEIGVAPSKAYKVSIIDKLIKIKPSNRWIPVESAFGGLAVYKKEVFSYASYAKDGVYPIGICEHVTFNTKIIAKGAKLYINPSLVNKYRARHTAELKFKYLLMKFIGFSLFEKLKNYISTLRPLN